MPKCRFGVHSWIEFSARVRKDGKLEITKVCARCGKQKTKVKNKPVNT